MKKVQANVEAVKFFLFYSNSWIHLWNYYFGIVSFYFDYGNKMESWEAKSSKESEWQVWGFIHNNCRILMWLIKWLKTIPTRLRNRSLVMYTSGMTFGNITSGTTGCGLHNLWHTVTTFTQTALMICTNGSKQVEILKRGLHMKNIVTWKGSRLIALGRVTMLLMASYKCWFWKRFLM